MSKAWLTEHNPHTRIWQLWQIQKSGENHRYWCCCQTENRDNQNANMNRNSKSNFDYHRLKEPSLLENYVKIVAVVALYWYVSQRSNQNGICDNRWFVGRFTSIVTVFVNKALLSSDYINLDAPLFVTWYQCLVSVGICLLLRSGSKWMPHLITFPDGNPFDVDTIRKVSIVVHARIMFAGYSSLLLFSRFCRCRFCSHRWLPRTICV